MKTALVVTTIYAPAFLDRYLDNLSRYDRANEVRIVVIPDRKTPRSVADACAAAVRRGFRVECPPLDAQEAFLSKLGAPIDWIPYDSDNRRNVGFLMALAGGCETLVSIDDDNFCRDDEDFFGLHGIVGKRAELPVRDSSDGWINLCDELSFTGPTASYPRGFPYRHRHLSRQVSQRSGDALVALNVGLWLDDPDVDAVGRLAERPRVTDYRGAPFLLGSNTWTPINTQNTALYRGAAMAYYYVRMGFPIEGLTIDRYGDILSGYFVQKCAQHLGQGIRVGDPICHHRRTPHNLFKDLYNELAGMVMMEELPTWLRELKLSGTTYQEAYACLADELAHAVSRFEGFVFDQGGRDFLSATAAHMRTWTSIVRSLGA